MVRLPVGSRPHGSASCDEQFSEFSLIRGRRDVECRVTSIDVMANRDKEVFVWASTAGADVDRTDGEIGG